MLGKPNEFGYVAQLGYEVPLELRQLPRDDAAWRVLFLVDGTYGQWGSSRRSVGRCLSGLQLISLVRGCRSSQAEFVRQRDPATAAPSAASFSARALSSAGDGCDAGRHAQHLG